MGGLVEIGTMKLIYQTVKNCGGLINQFDSSLITLVTESAGVWSTVEPSSKVSPGLAKTSCRQ
jgi:hypothetical protein